MKSSFKTVEATIEAIKSGHLSILDFAKKHLETIEKKNQCFNAIISQISEEIIENALQQIENSKKKHIELPPLAGFPIAVKDLENTKGILTTHGSPIFRNNVPKLDSPMVKNLKKAGCIVIGKTNVPEFGVGSQTFNPLYGSTRNPIDSNLTSGGSSGGAASAVASGMLPFADGSDMMGSLRNPAAFCSIYGFRPSPVLVPNEHSQEKLLRLSSLGGMAKTTKCLTYLLDAQIGNYNNDKAKKLLFSKMIETPFTKKEIRLAWMGTFNGAYNYEPEIETICIDYLKRLQSSKIKIDTLSPKFSAEKLWESWTTLRCKSIRHNLGEYYFNPKTMNLLKTEIIWEIEKSLSLTKTKIETAFHFRKEWIKFLKSLFKTYDFLLTPSAQVFPFPADMPYPNEINGIKMDTYHRWMEVVIPASLAGLPTISIPCGHNRKGLPAGIQLIGNFRNDLNVLKASHLFEKISN